MVGRRYARLSIDLAVDCIRGNERRRIYTRDLSAGGFLYVSDSPEKPGETFPIFLDLTTEPEPLPLRALIRHSRPVPNSWRYQIGVEFVDIDEFSRSRIQKFMDRFQDLQREPKETFKPLGLERG